MFKKKYEGPFNSNLFRLNGLLSAPERSSQNMGAVFVAILSAFSAVDPLLILLIYLDD